MSLSSEISSPAAPVSMGVGVGRKSFGDLVLSARTFSASFLFAAAMRLLCWAFCFFWARSAFFAASFSDLILAAS